ncbi:thioredoxin domain-containing protein [Asticcacaulis sp. AC402]|uniref:thioredoxin domain-containing protein n=1 Tax=Asticcacaulis sp. AC402 TaxID=1282361 RepID=UPI000412E3B8|nr:thioredoxin domain-containing protein [Asticcacaulis sp. AC402]
MSEPELPMPESSSQSSYGGWRDIQGHITTGLAVFAVILAGAPYVLPQVQAWQTQQGLLERPAMLQAASEKLQAQADAAVATKTREALKARAESLKTTLYGSKMDPILGNPAAPIKIVEFLDYNCTYCRSGAPLVKAFLEANPDVAIIIKEYPVISKNSRPLAAYALAAAEAGKYEAVHYAFMSGGVDSEAEAHAVLAKAGLNPQTIQARMSSEDIQNYITETLVLGDDLAITGTPTFIIDGEPYNGTNIPAMTAAVEKLRKKS